MIILIYPSCLFSLSFCYVLDHDRNILKKNSLWKILVWYLVFLFFVCIVRILGKQLSQTNHSSFCAVVTIVVDVVVWDKLVGSNCFIFSRSLDARCVGVRWPSTIFVVCTRVSQGDASFPTAMSLCVNAIYAYTSLIHSCRLLSKKIEESWYCYAIIMIRILWFFMPEECNKISTNLKLTLNRIFGRVWILTAYTHQQTRQNTSNGQKECHWYQYEPCQL